PAAQRAPGLRARAAARRGLGIRPDGGDEHDRRIHLQPAPQARGGRGGPAAAHQTRRRLRAQGLMARRLPRPRNWPVTWRLAAVSAGLTLAILVLFGAIVGNL